MCSRKVLSLLVEITFDTLVLQISRIGGRNTKDCAGLDRLFTNSLMAKFNLKGKGKKGKRPLEGTKVYRAIQKGLMKSDPTATEENIKAFRVLKQTWGGGYRIPPHQCCGDRGVDI
ncbi:hypothetical protein AALO_G00110290 [Alosa alosa]|uniref:Uncharacterized protein n=1 Tax=Alosa alosa TaxID=278164 RepID=A0AAV6GTD1_9TELE|nr:hypothetical protein AALO_G00110290 [Alosa alosa]